MASHEFHKEEKGLDVSNIQYLTPTPSHENYTHAILGDEICHHPHWIKVELSKPIDCVITDPDEIAELVIGRHVSEIGSTTLRAA